jgi:hypothetical protein
LEVPYHLRIPLAPAEGLVLNSAGFSRNVNGQDHAQCSKTSSGPDDIVMMTADQAAQAEQFLTDFIYPRIERDWENVQLSNTAGSSANSGNNAVSPSEVTLLSDYHSYLQRFEVPESLSAQWRECLAKAREVNQKEEEDRRAKECRRIGREVSNFQRYLQLLEESKTIVEPVEGEEKDKKKKKKIERK